MIAKDLMPWLFVNRKAQWTPFAKVRCEGGQCRWTSGSRGTGKKKAPDPKGSRALSFALGA